MRCFSSDVQLSTTVIGVTTLWSNGEIIKNF
jgi:hypothetical protein